MLGCVGTGCGGFGYTYPSVDTDGRGEGVLVTKLGEGALGTG